MSEHSAGDRSTWVTTTHDWPHDLDREHLDSLRRELSAPGTAGGRRHLILEVLAYAQDEAAWAGRRGTVVVTRHPEGSVSVDDDGRGTDTRRDEGGRVVRKPVMSMPDVRFTDVAGSPLLPDGLPRRGMSSVAALSARLVHENHRGGEAWAQTYRHGIPDDELTAVAWRGHSGTTVTFLAEIDGPVDLAVADLAASPDLAIRLAWPGMRQVRPPLDI